MQAKTLPFSVFGMPLLGLMGLLVCLWHPQMNLEGAAKGPDAVYLVRPSPRLDPSMTVFLKQEARNVAYSRKHDEPAARARIVADYNLIAQECTPEVFVKTHLPPMMAFR